MKEYILNQKTVGKRMQCLSDNENNVNLLLRLTDTGLNNLLELGGITVKHGLLQDLMQSCIVYVPDFSILKYF